MAETTQEAERLVREYAELWNQKDAARIPELISESFRGDFPEAEKEIQGHDELEEFMREFTSAFPDFHVEVTNLLASEDTVMVEGTYTMTHEGEFKGIPPTNREVEIQAGATLTLEEGKVKAHREYHDSQEILDQLGVTEE